MSSLNNTTQGMEGTLRIFLSMTSASSDKKTTILIKPSDSSSILRESVANATGIPLDSLRLIYRGRMISKNDDNNVISDFKLEDECVVHCIGKPATSSTTMTNDISGEATASTSTILTLDGAIEDLKNGNSSAEYITALETLAKLLKNIKSHPMEEKYRKLKKQNGAFQRRLGGRSGGDAAMRALGFFVKTDETGVEHYFMEPSSDGWPKLLADEAKVDLALSNAKRNLPTNNPSNLFANPGISPFSAGQNNGMGFGQNQPNMDSAVRSMLDNPQALQSMLQNPMIQQMMQNDPRLANNPMLQQSLNLLANNPQMMQRMTETMSNPAVRNQMMEMMRSGNTGLGNMPSTTGLTSSGPGTIDPQNMARQMEMLQSLSQNMGVSSGSASNANLGRQNNDLSSRGDNISQQFASTPDNSSSTGTGQSSGGSNGDNAMSEEEMIAEAIARSLREQ